MQPVELALDHLGQAHAPLLAEIHGDLLVVHVAIELGVLVVHQTAAETGLAHALEHHLHEQRFELARDLVQGRILVLAGLRLQGVKPREVGIDLGQFDSHQITTRSAFSAPACLSASRIATRSLGPAPTLFTARTTSSRVTPGANLNMRLPSSFTST